MAQQTAPTSSIFPRIESLAGLAGNWLVDLIFPPRCGYCGSVDSRFCSSCRGQLATLPLESGAKHVDHLDAVRSTGKQVGILESAVKSFKYHDAIDLCDVLAARLVDCLHRQSWQIDVIVPVPLHADRQLARGYNQSELLSQAVARASSIPCEPAWIARTRDTGQQAQLTASERRHNVAGAFQGSARVEGKTALLLDDVVTTGSTLRECAAALRASNAKAVYGIAVSQA